jgi:hypothetical protein
MGKGAMMCRLGDRMSKAAMSKMSLQNVPPFAVLLH